MNKPTKKQSSEMVRDGFNAAILMGKEYYPAKSINDAHNTLFNTWNIFSEFTDLEVKTVVIYDNRWNQEYQRFVKTTEGSYDQTAVKR